MSFLGAITRTVFNAATLPITLPIALIRDASDYMDANEPTRTPELFKKIKDDADADKPSDERREA
jgi:hypothetical protein